MSFASLMRAARAESGLTLNQLAEKVGYSSSYLSLVERGLRMLDEPGVVRIARKLGLDPAQALVASLRQRLPEELRSVLPAQLEPEDIRAQHAAARQLQAAHFDYEVDAMHVHATIDWDGNVRLVRRLEGCRPNAAGRPVWQLAFQDRVVGRAAAEGELPKFEIREAPDGLEHEHVSRVTEDRQDHILLFPKGWRRSSRRSTDSFCLVLETLQEGAYELDPALAGKRHPPESLRLPAQGSLALNLIHFVRRLEISLEFPSGYRPQSWDGWAWWGAVSSGSVERNLAGLGSSQGFELTHEGGKARLVVDEPLAGYTFAIMWMPADRQTYLEARHGFSSD